MLKKQKSSRALIVAAGVSLAAISAAALPSTAAYVFDEDEKAEKKAEKSKHKTVRVITSGKPIVIERSGGHYVLKSSNHEDAGHDHKHRDKARHGRRSYSFTIDGEHNGHSTSEAMEQIEKSLETVEKRLAKAKKKSEKAALEAARDGLKAAITALEARKQSMVHALTLGDGHRGLFSGDHASAFINLDEIGNLRETIKDALSDVEIDIDIDDDHNMDVEVDRHKNIKIIRKGDGKHRVYSYGHSDEKRLEALKKAEEHLKKSREELEKRLAEKKEEGNDKD